MKGLWHFHLNRSDHRESIQGRGGHMKVKPGSRSSLPLVSPQTEEPGFSLPSAKWLAAAQNLCAIATRLRHAATLEQNVWAASFLASVEETLDRMAFRASKQMEHEAERGCTCRPIAYDPARPWANFVENPSQASTTRNDSLPAPGVKHHRKD